MSDITIAVAVIDPANYPLPDRGGRVQFITESGSRYEIDYGARRWARLEHNPESAAVRSAEGEMTGVSEIVIGQPVLIFGPPIDPAQDFRMIETTPVLEIVLDIGRLHYRTPPS